MLEREKRKWKSDAKKKKFEARILVWRREGDELAGQTSSWRVDIHLDKKRKIVFLGISKIILLADQFNSAICQILENGSNINSVVAATFLNQKSFAFFVGCPQRSRDKVTSLANGILVYNFLRSLCALINEASAPVLWPAACYLQ